MTTPGVSLHKNHRGTYCPEGPHGFPLLVATHPWTAFVALTGVVLAITGAEARFADMGHFGRLPISRAWLFIVLTALVLNYLG